MKIQRVELEAVLLIVTDLLLLFACDTSALDLSDRPHGGAPRRQQQQRQQQHRRQHRPVTPLSVDSDRAVVVTRGSAPCRPIPHEVLWRKLDIVASTSKRHRRMPKSDADDRRRQEDIVFDEDVPESFGHHRSQTTVDITDAGDETRVTSELSELLLDLLERQSIEHAASSLSTPLSRQQRRRRNASSSHNDREAISSAASLTAERVDAEDHQSPSTIDDRLLTSVGERDDQLPSVEFRSRYRQMAQLRNGGNDADGSDTDLSAHRRLGHSPTTMASDTVHQQQHQCRLETYWKKMPDGTFPPYLETGRCRQTSCMFGLYECRPRRYTVKILRRMPRRCGVTMRHPATDPPLAAADDDSSAAIDEVWRFVEYPVIVGCDCSVRRRAGTFRGR